MPSLTSSPASTSPTVHVIPASSASAAERSLAGCIWLTLLAIVSAAFLFVIQNPITANAQSSVRPPGNATVNELPRAGTSSTIPGRRIVPEEALKQGAVPGGSLGLRSDTDIWRNLREGASGTVSIPDEQSSQLIRGIPQRLRTEAEIRNAMAGQGVGAASIMSWVKLREGPLARYSAYAMGATLVLLALFFLIRGRIRVEHGLSGRMIERFGSIERLGHWLLAISFIVLALTGLNLLYGRQVLIPLLGPEFYAAIAYAGKLTHNYVAFAFMAGLVLIFVNWARHNIPHPRDLVWLAKGGGLFVKGVHPSSKKFNAGQKIVFWLVILGGVSISLSGLALMFPFQTAMFEKTFVFLNAFGFGLPSQVSAIEEMQYQSLWHAIMAVFLICVILGHIYIGSIGMEGAIDAVTTGQVDVNWAREHHDLCVEEELGTASKVPDGPRIHPAE
jgi:formate dehydrogenase subunit gamma